MPVFSAITESHAGEDETAKSQGISTWGAPLASLLALSTLLLILPFPCSFPLFIVMDVSVHAFVHPAMPKPAAFSRVTPPPCSWRKRP